MHDYQVMTCWRPVCPVQAWIRSGGQYRDHVSFNLSVSDVAYQSAIGRKATPGKGFGTVKVGKPRLKNDGPTVGRYS